MSNIKLITVTNAPEHATRLIKSAEMFGWDLHIEVVEWKGFGTKLIATYEYLKSHPEVERFVFCDAFDVVTLGTPVDFWNEMCRFPDGKILISSEKGLWPPTLHPFKNLYEGYGRYPNSGLYYAPSNVFIALVEENMPYHETDDQFWFNILYMLTKDEDIISMDIESRIFDSHSFVDPNDYRYENNRVKVIQRGTQDGEPCVLREFTPIWSHFNGKTVDPEFDKNITI